MKTLAKISFLLLIFIGTANAQDVPSKSAVVAIHQLELNSGVNSNEFEAFVLENIIPTYNNMKGQKAMLLKGDRGVRSGKYAIVLMFESEDDRNRIYPASGGFVGDFGEKSMWEKFRSMAKGIGEAHTDYVEVTN